MSQTITRAYGWKRDQPDQRDLKLKLTRVDAAALPPRYDMTANMPDVFDQLSLGSCTANVACAAAWYLERKKEKTHVAPSRLFEYYNTRKIEGTVTQDSGASIRNCIKAMVTWGYCLETQWPYDITKFATKPADDLYTAARINVIRQYRSVPQFAPNIKAALASDCPVLFGISVYPSFESPDVARTGQIPIPKKNERVLGGHALLLVGYDDATKEYITRNSWGTKWGIGGYCRMPYDYVHSKKLAADFWVIDAVP